MSEEEKIPEDRSEAEGIRQEPESNEQIPGTSSDPTPSHLNPVRTDIHPGGPQPLKEMEVHHHAHVHEKKKWKEYLFQFLMLFLAVFCGFLAEYQLEHKIEKDRERQFIGSLFNDIKADTANLKRIIDSRIIKEHMLDSISYMMNRPFRDEFSKQIYFYSVNISRTRPYRFIHTDGTMQQLKNSGGLRLIRNRAAADSISRYDVNVRNMVSQGDLEENLIEHYRTAATKIFDALVFDQMLDENMNVIRLPVRKPAFQGYSERELYEWNYRLYSLKAINKANRRDARTLLQQAINLLNTLNKTYHLE